MISSNIDNSHQLHLLITITRDNKRRSKNSDFGVNGSFVGRLSGLLEGLCFGLLDDGSSWHLLCCGRRSKLLPLGNPFDEDVLKPNSRNVDKSNLKVESVEPGDSRPHVGDGSSNLNWLTVSAHVETTPDGCREFGVGAEEALKELFVTPQNEKTKKKKIPRRIRERSGGEDRACVACRTAM